MIQHIASAARPVPLRKRRDLVVRCHRYQHADWWVVKDPIGLNYFRFAPQDYAILDMLDGQTSLEQIQTRYQREFAPERITLSALQQFVGTLHEQSLVVSDAVGQGEQLFRRAKKQLRRRRLQKLGSVFALRFRGVDPQWLLVRLYPLVRWCFSPLVVSLSLMFMLSALLLLIVHAGTVAARLPTFYEFFGPHNWLLLAGVLAVTKITHELGHALACKHFGGECHQIGFMLLVMTPCLYCDVSDSWMLKSRWQRAAIGAAGIYVELLLASIAAFVWWFTVPGMVNMIALQVIFICSFSTLLFNANPLLRFDGYYILSDLLEIPNLRQQASTALQRLLTRRCLGLELPENPYLPHRGRTWFALYTVASIAYRWLVVAGIMLLLSKVFAPYGLKVVGQLLMIVGGVGMIAGPLWQLGRFLHVPGRMHQMQARNLIATAALLATITAGVALVPLPHYVRCPAEIHARDAASVYVEAPGQLRQILVEPGQAVQQGDLLAILDNSALQLDVQRLRDRDQALSSQLKQLHYARHTDAAAAGRIASLQAESDTLSRQLREKEKQLTKLTIVAPRAGRVVGPVPQPKSAAAQSPRAWHGSPLEQANLGAWLETATLLCQIGDPKALDVVLVVGQSDVERVHPGQAASLLLTAWSSQVIHTKIREVARVELHEAPAALAGAAGGELTTMTDATGVTRPLNTSYEARAALGIPDAALRPGLRGRAKIHTGYTTLARRGWRWLAATFRFHL